MEQKRLLEISLIVSLVGLLILIILSNILLPQKINIGDMSDKMLNQKVSAEGKIFKIVDRTTFKILSISDSTGKVDVLCNCEQGLKTNDRIYVEGQVKEYRKYLQISADRIVKIN